MPARVEKVAINKEHFYEVLKASGHSAYEIHSMPGLRSFYAWLNKGAMPVTALDKIAEITGISADCFTNTESMAKEESKDIEEIMVKEESKDIEEIPAIDYHKSAFAFIKNQKKSCIVKQMALSSKKQPTELAKYYGIKKSLIDRKMKNDGFSFADIVAAAYAFDFDIIFKSKDNAFRIDPRDYFDHNSETWNRIVAAKNAKKKNGWVFCNEEYPKDGIRVIVSWKTDGRAEYDIAHRNCGKWVFDTDYSTGSEPIPTMWMRVYHDEEDEEVSLT